MNKERMALLAVAILLFLVGVNVGYTFGVRSPFVSWITESGNLGSRSQFAELSFSAAKPDKALGAQRGFLKYLEHVEAHKEHWDDFSVPWMSEGSLNYFRAFTFGRIAILLENEGKLADADSNWINAEKEASKAGWKYPTREFIRKKIEALDVKDSEYKSKDSKADHSRPHDLATRKHE
jgi:hypothetical protein